MSGETEANISGWTVDTLKAHFDQRFEAIEDRTAEQKRDTREAVDQALHAAKELVAQQTAAADKAIDKSERAVSEQLKATDARVADVKTRVERIEAVRQGATESKASGREVTLLVVAVISLATAIALGVVAVLT